MKFLPGPGRYPGASVVQMSSTRRGATIRYTTDGTDPDETSPRYRAPLNNANSIRLSLTTTNVTLSYLAGNIANFGVKDEAQFRQTQFIFSPPDDTKKASVFGCVQFTSATQCFNLDNSATFTANSSAASIINASTRDALLQAFGTDNLTLAMQNGYLTKLGVVPPGLDEISGDVMGASNACIPAMLNGNAIKAPNACPARCCKSCDGLHR